MTNLTSMLFFFTARYTFVEFLDALYCIFISAPRVRFDRQSTFQVKCSNKTKSPGSQGPSPSVVQHQPTNVAGFFGSNGLSVGIMPCWLCLFSRFVFQHSLKMPQRLVGAGCYYHGIIVLVVSRLVPSYRHRHHYRSPRHVIAIIMVLVHFQNLASKNLGYLKFPR